MKSILTLLTQELSKAFESAGYDAEYGQVTLSKRTDIADYQCSGALIAAKIYKVSPIDIAKTVVKNVCGPFEVTVVKPGFINIKLHDEYIMALVNQMNGEEKLGVEPMMSKKVVIDYGGPNVAKPLHVGHLRSAIIGESIKRIYMFLGHEIQGDIHLGDWGLQIGLVIEELKHRYPDLCYFDENYTLAYPKEPPFKIHELSEIYPTANAKSKEDAFYLQNARNNTAKLQNNHQGYTALWRQICKVSIEDLKKNYGMLNVHYELWHGESHSMPEVPQVIQILKDKGLTQKDDGAIIVPVERENDKRPMPPMILIKSDGAVLYSTTDLTTIYQRIDENDLDEIIYVVDKRQELHFEQVFRSARLSGIVDEKLELNFIGFGTMNGTDGKPFKTRDGGVMKLEDLIHMLRESVKNKLFTGREDYSEDEINDISMKVGLAALKYGDLINVSTKDYVFDLDRFATFEGKTGPYILYSIVRIKSIFNKVKSFDEKLSVSKIETERKIHLKLLNFDHMMHQAFYGKAPHKICEYAFELSNLFNRFYHETKILDKNNENRDSHLSMLKLVLKTLETCLDLLGIYTIDRM